MMTKRVLIVDDHPVIVRGLQELIEEETELTVVGQAGTAQEAIQAIETSYPDIIIVDISLPGKNGISLIQDIKARWISLAIIVFSRHDTLDYAERALRAGAIGYIAKDDAPASIMTAIRYAMRGKVFLSSEINERLVHRLTYHARSDSGSLADLLSNHELEVFEAIGRGYETAEIADLLHVSPRTVESHRRNIKEKLGITGLTELVRRAVLWVEGQPMPLNQPDSQRTSLFS